MTTYAIIHEQGDRNYQEDSVAAYPGNKVSSFWVADGLGGHGGGKEASQLTVDNCGTVSGPSFQLKRCFDNAFLVGNQKLIEKQDQLHNTETMKTTLVGCVLDGNELTWAHIGDSRLYLFSGEKIVMRTLDHSVPQMLALGGQIKESEIRKHPDRNRVLRVLGNREDTVKYDISRTVLAEKGMKVLMCTDGFWEWITESEMESYLFQCKSVEEWLRQMKERVLKNGQGHNMDNFTALGIWI